MNFSITPSLINPSYVPITYNTDNHPGVAMIANRYEKVYYDKSPAPWDLRYDYDQNKNSIPIALDTFTISDPIDGIYSTGLQMRLDLFNKDELPPLEVTRSPGIEALSFIAVNQFVFQFNNLINPKIERDSSIIFTSVINRNQNKYTSINNLNGVLKKNSIYNIFLIYLNDPTVSIDTVSAIHLHNANDDVRKDFFSANAVRIPTPPLPPSPSPSP